MTTCPFQVSVRQSLVAQEIFKEYPVPRVELEVDRFGNDYVIRSATRLDTNQRISLDSLLARYAIAEFQHYLKGERDV